MTSFGIVCTVWVVISQKGHSRDGESTEERNQDDGTSFLRGKVERVWDLPG